MSKDEHIPYFQPLCGCVHFNEHAWL